MKKPKHTPGPWRLENRDEYYFDLTSEGSFISKISGQNKANAQLIAAAPELYEAAEMLLENIDTFQFEECKERLKDVLKKARGE